jgi:hypothetical protein
MILKTMYQMKLLMHIHYLEFKVRSHKLYIIQSVSVTTKQST